MFGKLSELGNWTVVEAARSQHEGKAMQIQTLFTTVIVGAALFLGSIDYAKAAPSKFCNTYASKSVRAYVKSKNFGCRFSGPEFHGWWEGHRVWCRSTPKGIVLWAHRERAKKLSLCIAQGEN